MHGSLLPRHSRHSQALHRTRWWNRIQTPPLITDPDGEQFWAGQSRQLYEALSGPRDLLAFTAGEGAEAIANRWRGRSWNSACSTGSTPRSTFASLGAACLHTGSELTRHRRRMRARSRRSTTFTTTRTCRRCWHIIAVFSAEAVTSCSCPTRAGTSARVGSPCTRCRTKPPRRRIAHATTDPRRVGPRTRQAWRTSRTTIRWRMLWRQISAAGQAPEAYHGMFVVGMNVPDDTPPEGMREFNAFYTDIHVPEVMQLGRLRLGPPLRALPRVPASRPGCPRFLAVYQGDQPATQASQQRGSGPNPPRPSPSRFTDGPPTWERHDTLWRHVYRKISTLEA